MVETSKREEAMTSARRACLPFELHGGAAVRVALAEKIGFLVVDNETRRALVARVSVDPVTETVTIVVGEEPPDGADPRAG